MYGVGQSMSYAGYRTKGIGSGAQVGLGAKVLEGVTFFGNRVRLWIVDATDKLNVGCLNFDGLTAALRRN